MCSRVHESSCTCHVFYPVLQSCVAVSIEIDGECPMECRNPWVVGILVRVWQYGHTFTGIAVLEYTCTCTMLCMECYLLPHHPAGIVLIVLLLQAKCLLTLFCHTGIHVLQYRIPVPVLECTGPRVHVYNTSVYNRDNPVRDTSRTRHPYTHTRVPIAARSIQYDRHRCCNNCCRSIIVAC